MRPAAALRKVQGHTKKGQAFLQSRGQTRISIVIAHPVHRVGTDALDALDTLPPVEVQGAVVDALPPAELKEQLQGALMDTLPPAE